MIGKARLGLFAAALLAAAPGWAAPAAPAPNVLLVIADDLNADLGVYGHPLVRTPNIDRLARRGVTFTRAYAQYPQCNQSRASLLTGLYPEETGVFDLDTDVNVVRPDAVTLPHHFRNHGYFTARVGKVFHQGVPVDIGRDGLDDPDAWEVAINPRGVDTEVDDRIVSIVPPDRDRRRFGGTLSWLALDAPAEAQTDGIGATRAIELLERHRGQEEARPFLLALGFYRPHTPFVAPVEEFERYPLTSIQPIEVPPGDRENKPVAALADRPYQASMSLAQRREAIRAYYASISFVDAQLGRVLDALERLGLAGNTIVVFTSDHGYQLGRHGLWQKGDLFEESTRVPLIVSAPGRLGTNERSAVMAELVDLYPTLVALAGLPAPAHRLSGRDLVPVLRGDAPPRGHAFTQAVSRAQWTRPERRGLDVMGRSVRTSRYRYTEWNEGAEGVELYDYEDDPFERFNRAADPAWSDTVRRLRSLLRGEPPPSP